MGSCLSSSPSPSRASAGLKTGGKVGDASKALAVALPKNESASSLTMGTTGTARTPSTTTKVLSELGSTNRNSSGKNAPYSPSLPAESLNLEAARASLRVLLNDDAWRSRFKSHLVAAHADENVLFVERMQALQGSSSLEDAEDVVREFLLDSSPHQLLVSPVAHSHVMRAYDDKDADALWIALRRVVTDQVMADLKGSSGLQSFVESTQREQSWASIP